MHRLIAPLSAILLLSGSALAQATAFRSTHVGFTTASGSAGDQILLRTGYGTSGAPESEQWSYRFEPIGPGLQQLQTRTERFVNNPNPPFAIASFNLWSSAPSNWAAADGGGISPVNGWYAQTGFNTRPSTERASFNPTGGDFFLNGPPENPTPIGSGFFAYEILSVTPVNGSVPASFALSMPQSPPGISDDSQRLVQGTNVVLGITYDVFGIYDGSIPGGGTLADRSVFLGNGNHFEGWGFYVSQRGQYEVAMRVYDTNSRYTSSDVFTFQVNSVPTPAALPAAAVLGMSGLLASRRRRK